MTNDKDISKIIQTKNLLNYNIISEAVFRKKSKNDN